GIPTKKKGRTQKRRFKNETYVINSVWQPKTIRLILSNVTYIGGVRYGINSKNGFEELNGLHEPIISKNLWDKAQERLTKIKKNSRTNHSKEDVYYCGTLVCGVCGQRLTSQRTIKTKKNGSTTTHFAYRCVNREKGKCVALGMSHRKVEEVFREFIESVEQLSEIENIKPIEQEPCDFDNITHLKKRLTENDNKRKEVMHLFMENEIDHNQMKYMITELDSQSTILGNELQTLEKQIQPTTQIDKSLIANTINEHWKYLSNKERLEFLNQFVESIVIVNRSVDKANGRPEIIDVKFYDE
ncbi:MAG: recombinase family protein, partial [Bacilli bacterium]